MSKGKRRKRGRKKKAHTKPKKARDWGAVIAWFRNSAGPIKDKKKEQSKQQCRKRDDDD